jgi:thiamine kinase-like enzyme
MELIINLFEKKITKIESIKKLSGGLTNDIYLINKKYIWKYFSNNDFLNHKNEKLIIQNLKNLSLYYSDDNNLCYNFIPGQNISKEFYDDNLESIILLTKKYNNSKIETDHFWEKILINWINKLPENNFTDKKELENYYNIINKKLSKFSNLDDDNVLCHHDVHSANILTSNDELNLIDLEFSFTNYYFVELGNIICELDIDYSNEIYNFKHDRTKEKNNVLKFYLNSYSQIEQEKLEIGILISHLYWCVWGIYMNKINGSIEYDYLKFSKIRLEELKIL